MILWDAKQSGAVALVVDDSELASVRAGGGGAGAAVQAVGWQITGKSRWAASKLEGKRGFVASAASRDAGCQPLERCICGGAGVGAERRGMPDTVE
jgi:hypothetical protein